MGERRLCHVYVWLVCLCLDWVGFLLGFQREKVDKSIGCKAEKVQFFIPILDLTVSSPKGPKTGATGIFFVQIGCVYDQFLYVKLFHKNFGPTDTYNGHVEITTAFEACIVCMVSMAWYGMYVCMYA